MLTPQKVTGRDFEKAVFGGYDISQVNQFLETLSQDYTALYRENAALKSKLKVLVDKVEEYRSTEDAMRLALLSAQKTAREMTEEAEEKSRQILAEAETREGELLREAEESAAARRRELKEGMQTEEAALLNARRRTAEYMEKLKSAMEAYQDSLTRIYDFAEPLESLPQPEAPAPVQEAAPESAPEPEPEPMDDLSVDEVADLIQRSFRSSGDDAIGVEPEDSNLPHIDYEHLRFGTKNEGKKKK